MSIRPVEIPVEESNAAQAREATTRNSLCSCGSGTKHKKCCGKEEPSSKNTNKSNPSIDKNSSLDNKTNIFEYKNNTMLDKTDDIPENMGPTLGERVLWNDQYAARISEKASQSFKIRQAIANFFAAGAVDMETAEWIQCDLRDLDKKGAAGFFVGTYYENLYRCYYRLGLNDSLYVEYDNKLGLKHTQIVATRYSMHPMCPVWGFRRSRIIRKVYDNYFNNNPNILKDYNPCHMVLTLRHTDKGFYIGDEFIGKRFFARELIEQFRIFRDNYRKKWKDFVYAGCYNIEVKKSKDGNGLHVHMHCLILQSKRYKVNYVREWIKQAWAKQTGATQIHYETLYYWDHEDKKEVDDLESIHEVWDEETQAYEYGCGTLKAPKKAYYKDTWTVEQTSRAIMEALKYNFKPDSICHPDGSVDVAFMAEVLNQSKGLRFTNRFNKFYGVKELNINDVGKSDEPVLDDPNDHIIAGYAKGKVDEFDLSVDEITEETFDHRKIDYLKVKELGYSEDFEKFIERFPEVLEVVKFQVASSIFDVTDVQKNYNSLVNPFTLEAAVHGDFKIVLGFPHRIRHRKRDHVVNPSCSYHRPENYYEVAQESASIGELTKSMMMGHYNKLLVYDDQERFEKDLADLTQLRTF